MSELYIGVMSGTSLDGVDVALCEIDEFTCKCIASIEYPLKESLKSEILHVIEHPVTIKLIGELDNKLGHLFADAVNELIKSNQIDVDKIRAIGLHGQTLWHQTEGKYPFSMQLGDANIVTFKTAVKVVSDFRRADVARGGQGAPFAPAFHQFMFAKDDKKVAVLNIGGMANISILGEKLIGYDTGCGNVLMDYWTALHKNLPFDVDGEWAKSAKVDKKLLLQMLEDEYFKKDYPKSTGREYFNRFWLENQLKNFTIRARDVQATLLALTTNSIADELKKFDIDELIVCGGGGKNLYLLESLKALLPGISLHVSSDSDNIEAMTFAWLAYKRIHAEKVVLKSVTGALSDAVLGGVYE